MFHKSCYYGDRRLLRRSEGRRKREAGEYSGLWQGHAPIIRIDDERSPKRLIPGPHFEEAWEFYQAQLAADDHEQQAVGLRPGLPCVYMNARTAAVSFPPRRGR